jgi:N-acetylglutamate synthase-like GNAT family acetyltransferase
MQWQKDGFMISTDRSLLDFDSLYQFLSNAYWSKGMPEETLRKAIEGSLCFGLYQNAVQVGFARMITDGATFGYLADVYVLPEYSGAGLGNWLMECTMSHPDLQGLRRIMLATADAHSLYEKFGFTAITMPERLMQIHVPDIYPS